MCSFLFLAKYCSNTVNEKQGLQYFWCVPSFVQVWNLQNISPTSFFFRSMKAFLWGRSSGTDTQWGSRSGLLWQPGLVFTLAWRDHSPEVAPDEHICQCPCLAWPPLSLGSPMACFWPVQQKGLCQTPEIMSQEGSWLAGEATYHDGHAVRKQLARWGASWALGQHRAVEPNVWVKRHRQCPAQRGLQMTPTPVTVSSDRNYLKDPR